MFGSARPFSLTPCFSLGLNDSCRKAQPLSGFSLLLKSEPPKSGAV